MLLAAGREILPLRTVGHSSLPETAIEHRVHSLVSYRSDRTCARSARVGVVIAAFVVAAGCGLEAPQDHRTGPGGPAVDPDHPPRTVQLPLDEAPCTVEVDGFGEVDIEDDYIPNVVACENGAAPPEALKAQAVQARGYVYYKLFVAGEDSIANGTGDQVYDCDYTDATDAHYQAAQATRGQYLSWDDHIIAPFYVAGAIPDDDGTGSAEDACVGIGSPDPTDTEEFVTYNHGHTGCGVEMTTLGWAPDDCLDNPYNRGCASQNGQTCLAERGWDYQQAIAYYYGDDIELETAAGSCGAEPDSPYDDYCRDQSDGWSCFDDSLNVLCNGGDADDTESCQDTCFRGQCEEYVHPKEQFCRHDVDEDGWYCFDDQLRVECRDRQPVATDNCSQGCENDRCIGTGENGDVETIGLVTESQGVSGGCSATGRLPLSPLAVIAVLMIATAIKKRRQTDCARMRSQSAAVS